jgi:S-adenosylmethionine:tRNA ribosyltransferase-isomerase
MGSRLDLKNYSYHLDKDLIAYYPSQKREESRLMILDRKSLAVEIKLFKDILSYLKKGDILVRNISKVIPARLFGNRSTGGKVEILFLSKPLKGRNKVLMQLRGRLRDGEEIYLPENKRAVYLGRDKNFSLIRIESELGFDYLLKHGKMPLPPYIKRDSDDTDRERYQTVYAKTFGSVAAPTAGLHFSLDLVSAIESLGVEIVDILLHVSYATFKPLDQSTFKGNKLHKEYYRLSKKSALKINRAKREGKRVIAVGTTTLRVLESEALGKGGRYEVKPSEGGTDIFIKPGYKFKIVDSLITNFHLPKTSLLLLVSAFAGEDLVFSGYNKAIEERMRFYSYGDSMLII